MTVEDLHRVQEIDTELLLYVDSICKKHGIEYFLYYGTLLGCIRHNGPIPWDDDVDIAMTRENYLKFINVAKNEIDGEKYVLKIMGSGSTQYFTETKIGKRNTIYCMSGTENIDIMKHVQLDIFCLESGKSMSKVERALCTQLWKFLRIVRLNKSEKILLKLIIDKKRPKSRLLLKFGLDLLHICRFFIGEKRIEKWGYQLFVDPTGRSDFYIIGSTYQLKKEWFAVIDKEYHKHLLPIPSGYDEILTMIYGDYMKYPPENKRYNPYIREWIFKEQVS